MIFIDGSDVKPCNLVLFAADFTACKIQTLAEPKPELLKGKKRMCKEDGYAARLRKVVLRSPFKKALVLTGLLDLAGGELLGRQ